MAQDPIAPIPKTSTTAEKLQMQAAGAKEAGLRVAIIQIESEEALTTYAELGGDFSPLAMGKSFKELEGKVRKDSPENIQQAEEQSEDSDVIIRVAQQFNKKNTELNPRTLFTLKSTIYTDDTPDEILTKLRNAYPDPFLVDETLDFLIQTTTKNASLRGKLENAKQTLNDTQGREVRAGRNIQQAAREFSEKGLGNPTALRDLYRDITGNPREAPALFDELTKSFPFPKMKIIIDFILHSLGQDMKAKGPSISRPELQRLFSEARTLQAILGVYRFFNSRMNLIQAEFKRSDLALPSAINFLSLAKTFMLILKERYPNVQRILSFASVLGISEELLAKIIIFTQLRDALRNVSPKLFKSEQHRQDVLMTFIEALSDLEDELEEDEEEEEEEES
jgi:type III secretion protein W